ncbi:XRE family transcriptional regulator [Listeria monocytogenes]|nr:XRE family transcriptional regulator [Listeria monocytogenes]EAD4555883.1 XRE family transcriptional regulator [Listeria monocytogenes]EAF6697684.1 XRE family transcriptional regulator [Listeria monocytogenes]EAH0491779.1 XRE family transcriptional regulator [Listeria monocytogenes]EKB1221285.1 helix-turn-helix transcriptional regulator [Listeria monocytogenes]
MDFGRKIKYRRQEMKYSAKKVAGKLNINVSTLYRYENNETKNFAAPLLPRLAEVLEISNYEIMDWLTEEVKNG